ncbi:AMP-binding protein, partial [Hyphomonas chukchiensis]
MIDVEAMPFIADIPRVQATRVPDNIAYWFENASTTFAELETRTNQVANGLISLGVEPGDRVAYLAKNTDVYYEMLFGCAKARAVMTGVNTRLAAPEIQFILSDAAAKVLFVGKDFYAIIDQIRDQLPDLQRIITIDGDREDWDYYTSWRNSKPNTAPDRTPLADDDVIQLYTSGTTGRPKGVQLTNENYRVLLEQAQTLDWAAYGAGEAVMNAMPLFHVAGVNVGILTAAQGAKAVVLRDIDPTVILKLVEEHRIAYAFWVPAVILMLTQHPEIGKTDFSSMKVVSYGASPIAESLLLEAKEI